MELPISVRANIYSHGYRLRYNFWDDVPVTFSAPRARLVSLAEGDDYFKETPEATGSLFSRSQARFTKETYRSRNRMLRSGGARGTK